MRSTRGLTAAAGGVLLALAVPSAVRAAPVASSPAATSPAATSPATSPLRLSGVGSGPGVGLALDRAAAAGPRANARALLATAFPGTTLVRRTQEARFPVWTGPAAEASLTLVGDATLTLPGAEPRPVPGGAVLLVSPVSGAPGDDGLPVGAVVDAGGGVLRVDPTGHRYRGRVEVEPAGAGRVRLVDVVSLDDAARGTTVGRTTASLPRPALRALAVAARGLALTRSRCTAGCPVYGGADVEVPQLSAAVAATSGQVLLWHGAPARTEVTVDAGGSTAAGGEWRPSGGPAAYLPAASYAGASTPWSVTVPLATAGRDLAYAGRLTGLEVVSRLPSGRVAGVRLLGTAGPATRTGADVARALGLRSSLFAVGGAAALDAARTTRKASPSGRALAVPHLALPDLPLGDLVAAPAGALAVPAAVPAPELAPARTAARDGAAAVAGAPVAAALPAAPLGLSRALTALVAGAAGAAGAAPAAAPVLLPAEAPRAAVERPVAPALRPAVPVPAGTVTGTAEGTDGLWLLLLAGVLVAALLALAGAHGALGAGHAEGRREP